jgi:hypothetical protein
VKRLRNASSFAMLMVVMLAACVARPLEIPFKFYGTSAVHPDGTRTAYFLIPGATPEPDEILMANEGTILKNHFRIVQIGADKVLVEDTQDKTRQSLYMEKVEKENKQ